MLCKRLKSTATAFILDFNEMPSPRALPLIGTTLSLLARGSTTKLHEYIDQRHQDLGPIFKEKIGPVHCVFVSDPEIIREVYQKEGKYPIHIKPEAWVRYNNIYGTLRGLFFMDGPEWWHHRRILNKLLLRNDTKWMSQACDVASDNLIQFLKENEQVPDLSQVLHKWSIDVMVSILLGGETYKTNRMVLEDQVETLSRNVHKVFETTEKLSLIPVSLAEKFKLPRWNRFVGSLTQSFQQAGTLMGTLNRICKENEGLLGQLKTENLNSEDIERIIIDLILAAGDTTAVSLEWLLYVISKHPETQEKLRNDPHFARKVLKETLRLYPIATFLTRILPEDTTLGGFLIPKYTPICMSLYTSGRDKTLFRDAERFQPERWDRTGPDYRPNMQKASLPFAMGLRSCIGRKIAEIQLQMTIVKIVEHFFVELCNKNEIKVALRMVARPSEPLLLKFRKY